jgi:hypothetical protein
MTMMATAVPVIFMTVVLVISLSVSAAVMVTLDGSASPIRCFLLRDGTSDKLLQLSAVEPDTSALRADVDCHAVALTFF